MIDTIYILKKPVVGRRNKKKRSGVYVIDKPFKFYKDLQMLCSSCFWLLFKLW